MGIYYSSVGTRLVNYLKMEGLTLEDFTVLSPDFTMYIRNLGRKSKVAIYDWLEENNLQAGKWDGREKGLEWYKALDYYKEHRDELRKAYPPKPIEQAEAQPKEDDWGEYRKTTAKEILMLMLQREYPDTTMAASMAVGYTDALIGELKKIH